ncbi:MAG: FAD-dependent oxidoreductase [Lachnospiraceae bacterium]|nr:FAD-dependent oxidoreductase [Lachnospiraceae bacterium]
MSEEKFDAIVVGGGLAGLTAAYCLAQAEMEVLLIERGDFCGSKNVTGGRIYTHSMEKLMPGFAKEAPLERKITKERIALMTETGALNIEYASGKDDDDSTASYSVLRSKFDKWFAEKAEEAGVMMVPGIRVDECLIEDGKVVGINAGGEEMYADVVILADGVNSLLSQQLGLKKELEPHQVAVGCKEVIQLDEEVINQRFNVKNGEGTAVLVAGDPTLGNIGGGFLYTNKDSISIGIVATCSDIGRVDVSIPDMLERFKNHPSVEPLITGGVPLEYSAHLVPEGGFNMIPEKLYADGVLICGDAAAFVVNLGYAVRGMDFAVESGRLAAEAVIKAKEAGDFSARTLSLYQQLVEDSFIYTDMKQYRNFPKLLERHEIFNDVPEIADMIMDKLFRVDGRKPVSLPMFAVDEIAKRTTAQKLLDLVMVALDAL